MWVRSSSQTPPCFNCKFSLSTTSRRLHCGYADPQLQPPWTILVHASLSLSSCNKPLSLSVWLLRPPPDFIWNSEKNAIIWNILLLWVHIRMSPVEFHSQWWGFNSTRGTGDWVRISPGSSRHRVGCGQNRACTRNLDVSVYAWELPCPPSETRK